MIVEINKLVDIIDYDPYINTNAINNDTFFKIVSKDRNKTITLIHKHYDNNRILNVYLFSYDNVFYLNKKLLNNVINCYDYYDIEFSLILENDEINYKINNNINIILKNENRDKYYKNACGLELYKLCIFNHKLTKKINIYDELLRKLKKISN